jgi:putative endonuclease
MTLQQDNGRWGEDLAAAHLIGNGMEILRRNWHYKHAEIDIIGKEAGIIVFVEVKTRADTYFGRPEEMVGFRKKKLIFNAASAFTYREGYEGEVRFDIVGIIGQPGKLVEIQHFKDAFYPGIGGP